MEFKQNKWNSETTSSYISRCLGHGPLPRVSATLTTSYETLGNFLMLSESFFINKLEIHMVVF